MVSFYQHIMNTYLHPVSAEGRTSRSSVGFLIIGGLLFLVTLPSASAFTLRSNQVSFRNKHDIFPLSGRSHGSASTRSFLAMYRDEHTSTAVSDDLSLTQTNTDVTKIGTLTVPNVGIGTIAWSSDSCKLYLFACN